ncbi:hypothetical protein B0H17DRAFT_284365 [Mycena rosella]|uniref:non-specific serine/threonine protein kinase n=1 Tax=Mycena rosella TaxID=1033263 RepID=A0AAD7CVY9_MYCRO|nr:hypothetical protein B0H17DRAFT_284365 [Mycena rosella]
MSSLTFACDLTCDELMDRPSGNLVLRPALLFEDQNESEIDDDPYTVTEATLIKIDDRSAVYRARLRRHPRVDRIDKDALDVVIKIDPTGKRAYDLFREAIAYETTAKKLQGTIVPVFYGVFYTQINDSIILCLVTQFCGMPIDQTVANMEDPFYTTLIQCVRTLHTHGATHGDLHEYNILDHDGRPVLIDLEAIEARASHVQDQHGPCSWYHRSLPRRVWLRRNSRSSLPNGFLDLQIYSLWRWLRLRVEVGCRLGGLPEAQATPIQLS